MRVNLPCLLSEKLPAVTEIAACHSDVRERNDRPMRNLHLRRYPSNRPSNLPQQDRFQDLPVAYLSGLRHNSSDRLIHTGLGSVAPPAENLTFLQLKRPARRSP